MIEPEKKIITWYNKVRLLMSAYNDHYKIIYLFLTNQKINAESIVQGRKDLFIVSHDQLEEYITTTFFKRSLIFSDIDGGKDEYDDE